MSVIKTAESISSILLYVQYGYYGSTGNGPVAFKPTPCEYNKEKMTLRMGLPLAFLNTFALRHSLLCAMLPALTGFACANPAAGTWVERLAGKPSQPHSSSTLLQSLLLPSVPFPAALIQSIS